VRERRNRRGKSGLCPWHPPSHGHAQRGMPRLHTSAIQNSRHEPATTTQADWQRGYPSHPSGDRHAASRLHITLRAPTSPPTRQGWRTRYRARTAGAEMKMSVASRQSTVDAPRARRTHSEAEGAAQARRRRCTCTRNDAGGLAPPERRSSTGKAPCARTDSARAHATHTPREHTRTTPLHLTCPAPAAPGRAGTTKATTKSSTRSRRGCAPRRK